MKSKRKSCIIICLAIGLNGFAQKSTDAGGGVGSGIGGNISYSIGQVVYNTGSGTNGSLMQGVQQPYNVTTVSGIEDAQGIELIYSTYPNPATDVLILKVENYNNENLWYQLFDIYGKGIESQKINAIETRISMNNLSSGTYLLKIIQDNKEVKVFKIVKN